MKKILFILFALSIFGCSCSHDDDCDYSISLIGNSTITLSSTSVLSFNNTEDVIFSNVELSGCSDIATSQYGNNQVKLTLTDTIAGSCTATLSFTATKDSIPQTVMIPLNITKAPMLEISLNGPNTFTITDTHILSFNGAEGAIFHTVNLSDCNGITASAMGNTIKLVLDPRTTGETCTPTLTFYAEKPAYSTVLITTSMTITKATIPKTFSISAVNSTIHMESSQIILFNGVTNATLSNVSLTGSTYCNNLTPSVVNNNQVLITPSANITPGSCTGSLNLTATETGFATATVSIPVNIVVSPLNVSLVGPNSISLADSYILSFNGTDGATLSNINLIGCSDITYTQNGNQIELKLATGADSGMCNETLTFTATKPNFGVTPVSLNFTVTKNIAMTAVDVSLIDSNIITLINKKILSFNGANGVTFDTLSATGCSDISAGIINNNQIELDVLSSSNTSCVMALTFNASKPGFTTQAVSMNLNITIAALEPVSWGTIQFSPLAGLPPQVFSLPVNVPAGTTLSIVSNSAESGGITAAVINNDTVVLKGQNITYASNTAAIGLMLSIGSDTKIFNQTLSLNIPQGSSTSPYVVNNVSTLLVISQNLSSNFVLASNLDMSGITDWEPIGSASTPFTGNFNGDNFTLSNFTASSLTNNVGFFGYTAPGSTVENLNIDNALVSGRNNVGIIAGYSGGTFSNNFATGSVTGINSNYVGGLVGQAVNIDGCSSNVIVKGNNYVGGLAGNVSGTVSNSYATFGVSGDNYVGGLVGCSSGNITKSYATGKVDGNSDIGGLAGCAKDISVSYASGNISGTGSNVGGIVGEAFGNIDSTVAINKSVRDNMGATAGRVAGVSTGTLTNNYAFSGMIVYDRTISNTAINSHHGQSMNYIDLTESFFKRLGFDFTSDWVMAADINGNQYRPVYKTQRLTTLGYVIDNNTNFLASRTINVPQSIYDSPNNSITLHYFIKSGYTIKEHSTGQTLTNGMYVLSDFTTDTKETNYVLDLYDPANNLVGSFNERYVLIKKTGTGNNIIDPLIIYNEDDLKAIKCNNSNVYYRLGSNITLNTPDWTPICNFFTPFTGDFDGGGFTVSNLNINAPTSNYVGLFGSVARINANDIAIRNLHVNAINVAGLGNTGIIAGAVTMGGISKCSASGTVTGGAQNIGGIAGSIININDSYFTGTVSGLASVGGLAGMAANIQRCFFAGTITSSGTNIGGLAGTAANIDNSSAISTITGTTNIGGLVGTAAIINNVFSAGTVTSGIFGIAGGISGISVNITNSAALNSSVSGSALSTNRITGGGIISNNYAYSVMKINGSTVSPGFLNGADTTYPATPTLFTTLGFDSEIWDTNITGRTYSLPIIRTIGGQDNITVPIIP